MTLEEAIRIARTIMPVRFKHWKAIKTLINSAEKQIPKRLVDEPYDDGCPSCGARQHGSNYCYECGQAIDWEEAT